VHVAWYVGVTVMALLEVIEWPLAIVIAVGHEIAHRSRNKTLRELAEGIEAAG
jgi:predicted membrane protein